MIPALAQLFGFVENGHEPGSEKKVRKMLSAIRIIFGVLIVMITIAAGLMIRSSEQRAYLLLETRFDMRAQLASRFVHSYVQDLIERENRVAVSRLGSSHPANKDLVTVVESLALEAAVLTDSAGDLIAVYPYRPELIGTNVSSRYEHLRLALRDGAAVSGVVRSAARGSSVVGFATRFNTEQGDRVFSGGWDLSRGPLGAFLNNLTLIKSSYVEIIDGEGMLIAGSHSAGSSSSSNRTAVTSQKIASENERYSRVTAIPGTPWRLIAYVDKAELYAPLSEQYWLPRIFLGALSAFLCVAAFLVVRLIESGAQLRILNQDLDLLARSDRLTNVKNRRYLEEELERCRGVERRYHQEFSVLMIDVDHFKRLNDEHGHAVGDEALKGLAAVMSKALRVEDTFGRWGGEEFMAILPHTSTHRSAGNTAERVRAAAESWMLSTGSATVRATVSIGCATTRGPIDHGLLERADLALYEAKALGRNRVEISPGIAARVLRSA